MQKRRIFLAMLLCMLWLTGFAQNDVTGVVKDGTGEPLIGVSVMIKGSTTGTVTDFDGNFTLKSVPSSAQLQFSYIGFQTQVVNVGNTTNFNITLLEDNTVQYHQLLVTSWLPFLYPLSQRLCRESCQVLTLPHRMVVPVQP